MGLLCFLLGMVFDKMYHMCQTNNDQKLQRIIERHERAFNNLVPCDCHKKYVHHDDHDHNDHNNDDDGLNYPVEETQMHATG